MSDTIITGKEINAVLRLLRQLHPDDGDAQLSILTLALVIGCVDFDVPPSAALRAVSNSFDRVAKMPKVYMPDSQTLDG